MLELGVRIRRLGLGVNISLKVRTHLLQVSSILRSYLCLEIFQIQVYCVFSKVRVT